MDREQDEIFIPISSDGKTGVFVAGDKLARELKRSHNVERILTEWAAKHDLYIFVSPHGNYCVERQGENVPDELCGRKTFTLFEEALSYVLDVIAPTKSEAKAADGNR